MEISLYEEQLSINDVFKELELCPASCDFIVKEAVRRLIIYRNFKKYNIEIDSETGETIFKKFLEENTAFMQSMNQTDSLNYDELKPRVFYREKINRLKDIIVSEKEIEDLFLKKKASLDPDKAQQVSLDDRVRNSLKEELFEAWIQRQIKLGKSKLSK